MTPPSHIIMGTKDCRLNSEWLSTRKSMILSLISLSQTVKMNEKTRFCLPCFFHLSKTSSTKPYTYCIWNYKERTKSTDNGKLKTSRWLLATSTTFHQSKLKSKASILIKMVNPNQLLLLQCTTREFQSNQINIYPFESNHSFQLKKTKAFNFD